MRAKIKQRAAFFAAIREFFADRDLLEVDTNLLRQCGVTDVNLTSLEVKDHGFLITSPEYAMKALIAAGSGDIYQLSHVFRGEEQGYKHLCEFTLLEWYRMGIDHIALMQEVADLLQSLLPKRKLRVFYTPYAEFFLKAFGLDIFKAKDSDISTLAMNKLPEAKNWKMPRDAWLDLLFTHFIEPDLGKSGLQFITEYPISQAALSKIIEDKQGHQVAARFEAYIDGIELCNGFWELTNAKEQRARFEADNKERFALNIQTIAIDEDFMATLEKGMPDCAGVALGVDRLLMIAEGKKDISQVIF